MSAEARAISISNFNDLMFEAKKQQEHQQMLFVFTKVEAPESNNKKEVELFHAGKGGILTPVMCVDKSIDELKNFLDLSKESEQMSQDWKVVFVACLDGIVGDKLTNAKVDDSLKGMVQYIRQGMISKYLAFDNNGELINMSAL